MGWMLRVIRRAGEVEFGSESQGQLSFFSGDRADVEG